MNTSRPMQPVPRLTAITIAALLLAPARELSAQTVSSPPSNPGATELERAPASSSIGTVDSAD